MTVAVPQVETGQGVWTALPQIVADELGAAWDSVAVEPAPLGGPYGNVACMPEETCADDRRLDVGARVRTAIARSRGGRPSDAGRRRCRTAGTSSDANARPPTATSSAAPGRLSFGELAEEAADRRPPSQPAASQIHQGRG